MFPKILPITEAVFIEDFAEANRILFNSLNIILLIISFLSLKGCLKADKYLSPFNKTTSFHSFVMSMLKNGLDPFLKPLIEKLSYSAYAIKMKGNSYKA